MPKNFRHLSRYVLVGVLGVSVAAGVASGLIMNTYFKTSFAEGKKIDTNIGAQLSISQFLSGQQVDYQWIKDGNFTVSTKLLNSEDKYEDYPGLVSYSPTGKYFSFDAACEGELTLSNNIDSSITYRTKFESTFLSNDVKNTLREQYSYLFDDSLVTKNELKAVKSITIVDVNFYDGRDLGLLTNLERVRVYGSYVTQINNNTAPETTRFYIPKEEYEIYSNVGWVIQREASVFADVSDTANASVMLFKEGGTIMGETGNIRYVEVPIGTAYSELPLADDIVLQGSNFNGWKDKASVGYDRHTVITEDVKLYADWSRKVYSVTYHINDGISENIVKNYEFNDNLQIISDSQVPGATSDPTYKFLGWSLDPDCKTVDFTAGQVEEHYFDDTFTNRDLYGVWAWKSFTIQLHNADGVYETINCTYGLSAYLPSSLPGSGDFDGYATESGTKTVTYLPGAMLTFEYSQSGENGYIYIPRNLESVKDLYGVFTPAAFEIEYFNENSTASILQQYRVHDDTSSGLITTGLSITFLTNEAFTIAQIEKTGYHFVGWQGEVFGTKTLFTKETGAFPVFGDNIIRLDSGNVFQEGFDKKCNLELKPYYEKNRVAFTFDTDMSDATVYNNGSVIYDNSITFSGSCTHQSYKLDYYYLVGDPSNKHYTSSYLTSTEVNRLYALARGENVRDSSLPNNTAVVNFMVMFTIKTYTIQFYSDGGALSGSQYKQVINHGGKVQEAPAPSKDGYTFKYWYKDNSSSSSYNFNTSVTSSFDLNAKWEKIPDDPPCVTGETLVTLADGSYKMIKEVERGDMLRTLNYETGLVEDRPAFLIEPRGEGYDKDLISVTFDNGTTLDFVESHDIFIDESLSFETINIDNYKYFIGKTTVYESNRELLKTKIIDIEISTYSDMAYSVMCAETFNIFTNDIMTLLPCHLWRPLFNLDSNYQYNQDEYNGYIDACGYFTYEELYALCYDYLGDTFTEDILHYMFYSTNAKMFKAGIAKGEYTLDELMEYMLGYTESYM